MYLKEVLPQVIGLKHLCI